MKKFKKLHKGMSLVEVLVAMTIFSVGTAAVTMAFATAVKYNTHNQRRDDELSAQQNAVQNGRIEGLELFKGTGQDHMLVYTNRADSKEVSFKKADGTPNPDSPYRGVTEYAASRTGKNDGIFDFQLKSFSTTIGGNGTPSTSKSEDTYRIVVVNESPVNYDIRVRIRGGKIFQGNVNDGYTHSSNLYCRSLSPKLTNYSLNDNGITVEGIPSKIEFGFKYPDLDSATVSPMTIDFYKDGYHSRTIDLNCSDITSKPNGFVTFTIQEDGEVKPEYT